MTEPKVAETIAEVRATLDQTWALVQEMALIALRRPVDFSVPARYDNPHDDR